MNLNEPSSCSLKLNTKRIQSQHEIKSKKYKSNSTLIIQKKISTCGFCSISGHRATDCSLKKGIGTEITGDSLIEYLQKNCPFKIIDSEQSCNVYREYITNITKIKHIRCQNLLCSTTPKVNIRPDIDNLIVRISGYDINGLVVNGYSNVLMELNIIIRYINQKKDISTSLFFTTLKENCVGREYYDIKESDRMQITNEVQVKLLEIMNSLITK